MEPTAHQRKNFIFDRPLNEALRAAAYQRHVPEAQIVREALERYLLRGKRKRGTGADENGPGTS